MLTDASLVRRLAHAFDAPVRERGRRYQSQGRVVLDDVCPDSVVGRVRGSGGREYLVALEVVSADAPRLELECECPHFARGHPCKHLFACLAELDRAPGRFALPGTGPATALMLDPSDAVEEEPEPQASRTPRAARPTLREPRAGARRAPADDPLAWLATVRAVSTPRRKRDGREILYLLTGEAEDDGRLVVRLMQRAHDPAGEPGRPQHFSIRAGEATAAGEADAGALSALAGCLAGGMTPYAGRSAGRYGTHSGPALHAFPIPQGLHALVLPLVASTGRLFLEPHGGSAAAELAPLRWDGDAPFELGLRFARREAGAGWQMCGELRRAGSETLEPEQLAALLPGGLAVADGRIVRLARPGLVSFLRGFRERGPLPVDGANLSEVMGLLAQLPLPALGLPEALGWSERCEPPEPRLRIGQPGARTPRGLVEAYVGYAYGDEVFGLDDPRAGHADPARQCILRRDLAREEARFDELLELGLSVPSIASPGLADVQLSRKEMPQQIRALLARGWRVDSDGVRMRAPGTPRLRLASNVDWFDLEGGVDFDGQAVPLPRLLAARERGDSTVTLGDGSVGLLPDAWLARLAPLAELGRAEGDAVRFQPGQATLVDALLADRETVEADALFRRSCRRLERVGRPRPRRAPRGFRGELRGYQEEGLGWLRHVQELGFGGCLADDMGLGKTVQVLALLEARRSRRARAAPPSLVVVPKSLVHNWLAEAARFAPALRVLDYTGSDRAALHERFAACDVVFTTYGTLRRDVAKLAEESFDYVILDEAQAIKNAASQTSKAARLLRAEHRLALSGTPVENHLGELWALFDFLNPGLLGASARRARTLDDAEGETVASLAHALRPFMLRRTKEQVLSELPAKTEQTLHCALEGRQKRLYDELRAHYRQSLLRRVEEQGMARSKIHVLEALLRLRQAACHPGLVDPERTGDGSAKLDLLLPRLEEARSEGHKALVFSQFTSLLAIVRERLDRAGVPYAYLDGRTRQREACVQRFQEDPDCRLFLVSLKAGGHGLNLTAADYVFLLDPWWNPAVEAQAVDRTHRIGQTRPVFAYRLVAEDTVEEKILALQETKRRLADAIVSGDRGLIRQLTREDLETLLG